MRFAGEAWFRSQSVLFGDFCTVTLSTLPLLDNRVDLRREVILYVQHKSTIIIRRPTFKCEDAINANTNFFPN